MGQFHIKMLIKPGVIGFLYEIVPFSTISKFVKIGITVDITRFIAVLT